MPLGQEIKGSEYAPAEALGQFTCTDEASFNFVAGKVGFYWAQAFNMEGKKGVQYTTVSGSLLFRYFKPSQ